MAATVTTRGLDVPLTSLAQMPKTVLQDIGDLAVSLIRRRTEQGVSVDGSAFAPLSPGYAKAKRDAGLSPTADLTVSGRMLNDMRATVPQPGVIELRFVSHGGRATGRTFIQRSRSVGAADKAYFHHEAGAGKSRVKRPFFDLNAKELAQIETKLLAQIDKVLR